MTKSEIACAFSMGNFESTFDFIVEDAIWIVVEESETRGRQSIREKCAEVGAYFKSVQTDFQVQDVISAGDKVIVRGTAEFLRAGKTVSFISACDVYEFNERNEVQKITSYCIQRK